MKKFRGGGVGFQGYDQPRDSREFSKSWKKFSQENCNNWIILVYFQKIHNPVLNFSAFGRNTIDWRNFDETSIEKLNFYLFLGKVVAKNKAF